MRAAMLNAAEVARLLGVTGVTLALWREIPALGFPRAVAQPVHGYAFEAAEIMAWLEAHRHELAHLSNPCPTPPIVEYTDLVDALRTRRRFMGMTNEEVEHRSGLQEGYVSKLENYVRGGPGRAFGPVILPLWLKALDVGLVVVETKQAA